MAPLAEANRPMTMGDLYDTVTIVDTREKARRAVAALYAAGPGTIHACDTEVSHIDVKLQSPVGNGFVTCISIYSGPNVDFGEGAGKTLWVDNLDEAEGVLDEFKAWFEDDTQKKVWHNYGFDRHVMYNMGIDCLGFAGDTMHMARLADSSRERTFGRGTGYSLEALTTDLIQRPKVSMKEIFGVAKLLKSGAESKVRILPPIDELQRGSHDPAHRPQFIKYSAYDAESTWLLHQRLEADLVAMAWTGGRTMKEYYDRYMVAFGECLTDMERRGIEVDAANYLKNAEEQAKADRIKCMDEFRSWLIKVAGEDGAYINPGSSTQMQTLLFGGAANPKDKNAEPLPTERVVKVELDEEERAELERYEAFLDTLEADAAAARQAEAQSRYDALRPNGAAPLSDATAVAPSESDLGHGDAAAAVGTAGLTLESIGLKLLSDLETLKVAELKVLCRTCGVKVSGKKAELQERIRNALAEAEAERLASPVLTLDAAPAGEASAAGLAAAEKERMDGVMEEEADPVTDLYTNMGIEDLRDVCKGRNLNYGSRSSAAELKAIIREDDMYAFQLDFEANQARQPSPPIERPEEAAVSKEKTILTSTLTPVAAAAGMTVASEEAKVLGAAVGADGEVGVAPGRSMNAADASYVEEMERKFRHVTGKRGNRRYREVTIRSLGLTPEKFTASGQPAVSVDVIRELAGKQMMDGNELDPDKFGKAYGFFGGGEDGEAACRALNALCQMSSIETMLGTFIQPLQELVDEQSRIHCSMNLNTETGRLSARRPNLQNQPALEKDQYKIRDAFTAGPGNMLIVADYGQLELRLLAHITNCVSMLDAFESGGCFHSRTAVGMFDHVKKAVEEGEVLLEWDYSKGQPTAPLVKDTYGSERRKAKTLNFSIAYGKTPHGLAKDWGVTREEAQELLDAWYADRPEVKQWQQRVIEEAKRTGNTRTLMGRYRKLPEINSRDRGKQGHSARAAINTPIQGGAADVVMVAMVKINQSPLLAKLGFKLLLQIHDEVILEGPEEHVEEALAEVRRCMEHPWSDDGVGLGQLRVSLDVDAKYARTWYEAK